MVIYKLGSPYSSDYDLSSDGGVHYLDPVDNRNRNWFDLHPSTPHWSTRDERSLYGQHLKQTNYHPQQRKRQHLISEMERQQAIRNQLGRMHTMQQPFRRIYHNEDSDEFEDGENYARQNRYIPARNSGLAYLPDGRFSQIPYHTSRHNHQIPKSHNWSHSTQDDLSNECRAKNLNERDESRIQKNYIHHSYGSTKESFCDSTNESKSTSSTESLSSSSTSCMLDEDDMNNNPIERGAESSNRSEVSSLASQSVVPDVLVEDASDSENNDDEWKSIWRNRRPSPGQWMEPVEYM